MHSENKHTQEFRLKVVKYALKNKISEAAILFGINRITVSRWVKRYREEGESSLSNISRQRQKHPDRKISAAIEKNIVDLKRKEPDITIRQIIDKLKLDCSQTVISRILKYNDLPTYNKNIPEHKLQRHEFKHEWDISCKYLTTKYIDNKKRYLYKIALRERSTGIEFTGYTYERSNLSIGIFTDYILYNLKQNGIDTSEVVINAPKSSVFSNIRSDKETFLDNILNIKYKAKLSIINNRRSSTVSDLCFEDIKTGNDLIRCAFMGVLQNNLDILSSGFKSDKQKINSLMIPPIIVDDFINDIEAMKNFDHYWHSLSLPEVRDKLIYDVLEGLKTISEIQKNNYENDKALALYDKIIATLQYTQTDNKELRMTAFYKKGEIYQLTGDYSKAIEQLEHSLDIAEELKEYKTIADSSYLLGDLFKVTQSEVDHNEYYSKAMTAARTGESDIIKYYQTLGIIFSRQLNFIQALSNFNIMLDEAEKQDDDLNYSSALQHIGETYRNMSMFSQALEYFNKRISIETEFDDKYRLMELYNSLASVYYELEDHKSSLKYFLMQLDLAKEIGDKGSEAIAYKKIGDIHFNILKENKSAVNNYLHALNIFEGINDKVNQCMTLILISIVYKRSKNLRKAVSLLNKSKKKAGSINNQYVLCCVEGQLGSIYLYQNKLERSLDALLIQEQIARDNNFNSLLANSSKFISYIYLTMKRYARADIYDTEAKKIYSVLNQRYGENEIKRDFIHQEDDYQYLTSHY